MTLSITINHTFSLSPTLEAIIMSVLDDLKSDLSNLDASVTAKSTAVTAKLTDLAAQITALTAQVASGVLTSDDAAAIKAEIATISGHVDAIPADAPAPVVNQPVDPPVENPPAA